MSVETISADELSRMKSSGEDFVLVDVLDQEHFEDEHVPGAINIPYDEIASEALDRFDKDQTIVVYCKNEACTASPEAAEKLDKLGFKNVKDFEAGTEGWNEAGNETESTS